MARYDENIMDYKGKYKARVYDGGWVTLCQYNSNTKIFEDVVFDNKEAAEDAIEEYYKTLIRDLSPI